jgi:hypothetical protein
LIALLGIEDMLRAILCWLSSLVVLFERALVAVVQMLIDLVVWLVASGVELLPDMPEFPTSNEGGNWLTWANFFLPVQGMAGVASLLVGIVTVVLLVRVALRWVKAL